MVSARHLSSFLGPMSAAVLALCLQSCTSFFPSLDGPLAIWAGAEHIPKEEIGAQIICDLREFLRENKDMVGKVSLDKTKPVSV